MNIFNVLLIKIIEGVLKFILMLIQTGPKTVYRPVAPEHNSYGYRGQYQDIQTALGSWYRP
jgi:hypothetical protein